MIFETLDVWIDPEPRSGPEAMAVDEWLLDGIETPLLRVYRWRGEWGSLGYFSVGQEAARTLPGVEWVRRWTGGGVVDHRRDWTYSLLAPAREPWAMAKGAESYRQVHKALLAAVAVEAITVRLSDGSKTNGAAFCFNNPVSHDLIGRDGEKFAGAGQRKTKHGRLHQGSFVVPTDPLRSRERALALAERLSRRWREIQIEPDPAAIRGLVRERYGCPSWTARR